MLTFDQIWDIQKKSIRHLLQGHMQEIYSLDFSRDGRFLVSGSGDKSARLWDIETGRCVYDLRIDDFIHNEHGPIDAGITSVACKFFYTYLDGRTEWLLNGGFRGGRVADERRGKGRRGDATDHRC